MDEWTMYDSVFNDRLNEADSRDFYDDPRASNQAFHQDWRRVLRQRRLRKLLEEEAGGSADDTDNVELVLSK